MGGVLKTLLQIQNRAGHHIIVLIGGGGGGYSMVFPSWCAGTHLDRVVHQKIEHNPFCEIPALV